MNSHLLRFHQDESGPTIVEYAVLLALIAGVCLAVIVLVGLQAGGFWDNNADEVGRTFAESGVAR